VFIDQAMIRERIEGILDDCLLTDVEFAQGPSAWSELDDPLPPLPQMELKIDDLPFREETSS